MTNQEKSKGFLTELSKEDKFLYKVIGTDSEYKLKAWWIIRVKPEKLPIFKSIISKGFLNFADYGEILESGFGSIIPQNILDEYGF
ncbi:MAG: hypothetical protein COV36_03615 [Alphaproteobacteria bacterium CG11_big_fil_rev_8_21_14_0_20_44_7]|nr:MAG: hypothetical protein COV36_03615 [Alphaproteobacteria bacterium CG11_big_fil_rev_8_21_14_0_20_44_7]